jgi:hypothetical protein
MAIRSLSKLAACDLKLAARLMKETLANHNAVHKIVGSSGDRNPARGFAPRSAEPAWNRPAHRGIMASSGA